MVAFTTHTESLDLEDLTRGFRFSVQLARLAGQPLRRRPRWTDVTSHTGVTATVLAHAGVKFFHLGANQGCSHPDVPLFVLVARSRRFARADHVLLGIRLGPSPAAQLAAQGLAVHVDGRRQPRAAQHPRGQRAV